MSGQRGRCCRCDGRKTRAVTIKGMNQSDGVTQWEYGPGSWWRHKHGGDKITGIQWNGSATLNKFVLVCGTPDVWNNPPSSRVSGAFAANAMQPLELVTLDADDGSVVSTADLELFCSEVDDSTFVLLSQGTSTGYTITDALTLSDGDYLIKGLRPPALEWVDYTTDTANKEYVLHAHIMQAGNVYLKTKTSSETITLAYNATASDVATAFNATADCTACTATGGPWPHRKIEISVTWSASTGDISQMKRDGTYSVTGSTGTCLYDWVIVPPSGGSWILVSDSCTLGSTPSPPSGSGPGTNVPGTCTGGSPPTTTRATEGCAATYDVTTGLIETSVGSVFGRDTSTPSKLVTETGSAPSYSSEASLPIGGIAAGDSASVGVVTPIATAAGRTVESWTPGTPWTRNWQKYNNTSGGLDIHSQGSYFGYFFPKKAFTGGSTVSQVRLSHSTGSVTEYNSSEVSTTTFNNENWHAAYLLFNDQSKWVGQQYERWSNPAANNQFGSVFASNSRGSEVYLDSTILKLALDGLLFGATTSAIYGRAGTGAYSAVNVISSRTPQSVAGGSASSYSWNFFAPDGGHNGGTTQWRFVFRGGTTSWLDWDATDSEVATAVLAVYPENTSGSVSNVSVNPFSITAATVNTIGIFERRLEILFRGAANATGVALGFPPRSHFDRPDDIRVEFRNVQGTNTAGMCRWNTSGGQVWVRNWGTSTLTASTVTFPQRGWLYSTLLIAYGEQVENELP